APNRVLQEQVSGKHLSRSFLIFLEKQCWISAAATDGTASMQQNMVQNRSSASIFPIACLLLPGKQLILTRWNIAAPQLKTLSLRKIALILCFPPLPCTISSPLIWLQNRFPAS